MEIPVPLGDVVDKITILRVKSVKMTSPARLENVARELKALEQRWSDQGFEEPPQTSALEDVNGQLWDVEDALRRHEASEDFGPEFVRLARSVYHLNDRRAALKRAINDHLGSELVEEKEYVHYQGKAEVESSTSS